MIIIKQRNTFQKNVILNTVKCMHNHPTADDIYENINRTFPTISKATVYRNLAAMASKGEILKIVVPSGSDAYDFNTRNHCHFKCEICGCVFDINAPVVQLDDVISSNCNFVINSCCVLYYGICPNCINESDSRLK